MSEKEKKIKEYTQKNKIKIDIKICLKKTN